MAERHQSLQKIHYSVLGPINQGLFKPLLNFNLFRRTDEGDPNIFETTVYYFDIMAL